MRSRVLSVMVLGTPEFMKISALESIARWFTE